MAATRQASASSCPRLRRGLVFASSAACAAASTSWSAGPIRAIVSARRIRAASAAGVSAIEFREDVSGVRDGERPAGDDERCGRGGGGPGYVHAPEQVAVGAAERRRGDDPEPDLVRDDRGERLASAGEDGDRAGFLLDRLLVPAALEQIRDP